MNGTKDKTKNKTKKLKKSPLLTWLAFLHSTLLLAPVLPLFYAFIGVRGENLTVQFWLGALLLAPVILSWLAVRCCRALWLYTLSGIAAAALAFFAARNPVFTVLTALLWVIRGGVRIKKGKLRKAYLDMPVGEDSVQMPELAEIPMFLDEPHPVHFIVFVLFYLISLPLGIESLYRYIFALLFAEILVCFLFRYLTSFWDYVEEHQSIANLPVQTMRRIIRLLLVPALLILLLVMLPSLLYGEEPLTKIRFQFDERNVQAEMPEPAVQGTEMTGAMLDELMIGVEASEPPRWLEPLMQALVWVVLAAAAVILLRALYRALCSMNRSFLKEEEDEITFLGEEDRKEKRKRKQDNASSRLFPAPAEQIRKRLVAAAELDLPVALYNPASTRRRELLEFAVQTFRAGGKNPPFALVRDAYRANQRIVLGRLEEFPLEDVQMTTLVLIGNSHCILRNGRMFCPRGYREKYDVGR